MSGNDDWQVNRRDFLQTGAMATASAVTLASGSAVAAPPASKKTLPRRPLGKTGVDVTILNLGTWKSPGTRPPPPLRLRQRRPLLRHGQVLRLGARRSHAGSRRCPRSARRSSWSPRTTPTRPGSSSSSSTSGWRRSRPITSTCSSSTGSARRLRRGLAGLAQEQGIQGDDRGDQEVGQGQVRRLLVPRPQTRRVPASGGRRRVRRRDHGAVHRLAHNTPD